MSVAGAADKYYASSLSFLPRNIGSLHQPDMFAPAATHAAGGSTPIRDEEEGGSTPVLDEPDDDDIPAAASYSTPMVLAEERKPGRQQNLMAGPHTTENPEFSYRIMRVNEGIVSSQRPDDNGSMAAPPPGTFGPDGTVVYRTDVVDGFQSASEAFHPPPDFFRSETDFSVPPPGTIYQVKDEGFIHASESLPVLAPSTRDVVYTVVTTVQQPAPASYYPVVIEVPSFAEPPHKLATFQPPPAPFVHPPPAVFNPSLPPPALLQSNLPPPGLAPPPTQPQPQPVSVHYTVPPPANIQVVVAPHTLRSPLPAPPKSAGPPPIYVSQQSISHRLSVPTRARTVHSASGDRKITTTYQPESAIQGRVRTLHSPNSDRETTTMSYRPESFTQGRARALRSASTDENTTGSSYQPESIMQGIRNIREHEQKDRDNITSVVSGIRHIRESQQKDKDQSIITSVVSVIPTVGMSGGGGGFGQSHTQHKPTMQRSPVAGQRVPSLLSLKPPPAEVARRMSKSFTDDQQSPSFAGNKRRLSGSVSEDSLSKPEAAKILHESEEGPDVGLMSEDTGDQLSDDIDTEEFATDVGNNGDYARDSVGDDKQIPTLLSTDRGTAVRARFDIGGGPRSFGIRMARAPFPVLVRPRMPRIPRMPRAPRPMFRGGPVPFWGGGH